MKKIAIFGSGSGSNAENICLFFANSPDIKVVFLGTNNKNAFIVNRAKKLGIPTFAMVDTNSDPNLVDFPIPSNDDASKSIDTILSYDAETIQTALNEREVEKKDKPKKETNQKATVKS